MLSGIPFAWLGLLALAGIALDMLLGEPRRWHPLVGFGNLANAIERRLNQGAAQAASQPRTNQEPGAGRPAGVLAWCLAVLPIVALPCVALVWLQTQLGLTALAAAVPITALRELLAEPTTARFLIPTLILHVVLLYACLGLRSLRDHTKPISTALRDGDLATARKLTSYIVSRDTADASESDLAKAGVESLLENGNDAVFGTLFWFAVAGGPGALLFRLANTLDAMWGYRNPRFNHFGWAAARIDDVLNWIPARLTACSYALLGNRRLAWQCWRSQAPAWPSPNAGPVMAAGAGALGLALGREATYDGVPEVRPPLGMGEPAKREDLGRAWRLVWRGAVLWVALLLFAGTMQETAANKRAAPATTTTESLKTDQQNTAAPNTPTTPTTPQAPVSPATPRTDTPANIPGVAR
ncbi:cobalamin biosynthesis protein CobD [Pigmentiphaga aceris]|uniref:Cobalamin biosynthesis protein CobD n=1 Tax=Pigmentiphaga aceris TaxID=1940612 RepID=A0A5C0B304_9BURK|nr:adenosylcobinamide-phosphate synthase CbiB [Pigmentiphaga aceris]QEI08972.1 cobalamin biosynthesis protein CobD [Pigmentiphaga aceris]